MNVHTVEQYSKKRMKSQSGLLLQEEALRVRQEVDAWPIKTSGPPGPKRGGPSGGGPGGPPKGGGPRS